MPIDLSLPKKTSSANFLRVKKFVVFVTHLVLVVWVIALVGFLGWSTLTSYKQKTVGDKYIRLQRSLTEKAESEILLRKVYSRSQVVLNFLAKRGDPVKHLDSVLTATPAAYAWNYQNAGAREELLVRSGNSKDIQRFIEKISELYGSVRLDKLRFETSKAWDGTIVIGGIKS